MLQTMPKFMENEEWYYEDNENPIKKEYDMQCLRLTDKAPKEAVESYLDYCSQSMEYYLGYVPEFINEEYRKHMKKFL